MNHTPRYIEKCRRTERRGHGGDDDGGGAGRERDEVLQKVKDKERLLEGGSSSTKLFSPLSSSNLRREKEREREREREK